MAGGGWRAASRRASSQRDETAGGRQAAAGDRWQAAGVDSCCTSSLRGSGGRRGGAGGKDDLPLLSGRRAAGVAGTRMASQTRTGRGARLLGPGRGKKKRVASRACLASVVRVVARRQGQVTVAVAVRVPVRGTSRAGAARRIPLLPAGGSGAARPAARARAIGRRRDSPLALSPVPAGSVPPCLRCAALRVSYAARSFAARRTARVGEHVAGCEGG